MTRRPRVIVYVTRENPETAFDELLVFDVLAGVDADLSAVVPGGGLEPGEDLAAAAQREVREETGLERIRVLREVGFAEQTGRFGPDFVHETHFLQAVPEKRLPDEWEHEIPPGAGVEAGRFVRCRWLTIREDLEIPGNRGAFVHALIRQRVVAYVTRERGGRTELLTIEAPDDPDAGVQVPAGRIDYWESVQEGLLRELAEETGLTAVRIVGELPGFECTYRTYSRNHAFHLVAEGETADEWLHRVHGEGVDAGQTHVCRWRPLTADLELWNGRDPMLAKLQL